MRTKLDVWRIVTDRWRQDKSCEVLEISMWSLGDEEAGEGACVSVLLLKLAYTLKIMWCTRMYENRIGCPTSLVNVVGTTRGGSRRPGVSCWDHEWEGSIWSPLTVLNHIKTLEWWRYIEIDDVNSRSNVIGRRSVDLANEERFGRSSEKKCVDCVWMWCTYPHAYISNFNDGYVERDMWSENPDPKSPDGDFEKDLENEERFSDLELKRSLESPSKENTVSRSFQQPTKNLRPEISWLDASVESICEDCWRRCEHRWWNGYD